MTTKPLVSILTPTYNHASFIGECIESVLSQTYENFELHVLDDGSSDGTYEIARSYRDPRIKCHKLPHRGLSALAASYNFGLRLAGGEFVAILDGDDAWPAHKLSAQLPYMMPADVVLSWGGADLMDKQSRFMRATTPESADAQYAELRGLFQSLALRNFISPACTVMMRRSALDAIGGFTQRGSTLTADYPTLLRLIATQTGRCCYVPSSLGHYRVYPEQTSQRHRGRMAEEYAAVVKQFRTEIEDAKAIELGWTNELARRITMQGKLVKGRAHLEAGEFAHARKAYVSALTGARRAAEHGRAWLGFASAVARYDFHRLARALWPWRMDIRPFPASTFASKPSN